MKPSHDSLDDRHQRSLADLEEEGTPEAAEKIREINALAAKFLTEVDAVLYGDTAPRGSLYALRARARALVVSALNGARRLGL